MGKWKIEIFSVIYNILVSVVSRQRNSILDEFLLGLICNDTGSVFPQSLRNAFRRMGAPNNLIPDHIDGSLSFSIITYLKNVKHQVSNRRS